MDRRPSLGDKAILWGTALAFGTTFVGFVVWLTHIDYRVTTLAQAQEQVETTRAQHDESVDRKLDVLLVHVSRIEGAVGVKDAHQ